jgi:hypothetical protein
MLDSIRVKSELADTNSDHNCDPTMTTVQPINLRA